MPIRKATPAGDGIIIIIIVIIITHEKSERA